MHAVYKSLDAMSEWIGRIVMWTTLFMVLVQFLLVVLVFIFQANSFVGFPIVMWNESIHMYLQGALIMLGAGYTLLHNGHVRVDIFYRPASQRQKDWTDLLGGLFFILPVCILMFWASYPSVIRAFASLEGSTEPLGIPYKYALKSLLLIFPVLLGLQAISMAIKCSLRLSGQDVEDPYFDLEGGH